MLRRTLIATALSAVTAVVHAGLLDDALKDAADRLGRRGVNEAADKTYDTVKEGAGKTNPAEAGKDNKPGTANAPAAAASTAGTATMTSADEQVYSRYDFVPGDKVIFFDDFSDTDVGEFPRK